jgi:hypothetical protein
MPNEPEIELESREIPQGDSLRDEKLKARRRASAASHGVPSTRAFRVLGWDDAGSEVGAAYSVRM